ncbi:MAG: ribonuclease III [Chloroflexota bacterium]
MVEETNAAPFPPADLVELERRLGLAFVRPELLAEALVHRSYLNESPDPAVVDNERLEFLGDAIIGYFAAQYLFSAYPDFSEGQMTTVRAALVRAETLARWAQALRLGEHLRLSHGEESSGGRERRNVLSSVFEAVVAAIALDQGLEAARTMLLRYLEPECRRIVASRSAKDFKSRLQEAVQFLRQQTPTYRTVEALGPEHARTFVVEVVAGEEVLARATGPSKQEAEQAAAEAALATLPGDALTPLP